MRLRALSITLVLALFALPLWANNADGDWIITIKSSTGEVVHGYGALTLDGGAVKGWVSPSADQPIDVDGTLTGRKLILHTHPSPGRTVAFAEAQLDVRDNSMQGTMNGGDKGNGTIVFKRK